MRIIRPIFHDGELIAFSQSNGHWADVGGSVPGSFDVSAKEHFAEGIRIPAVRIADKGTMRDDVVELIVSNTRVPSDAKGDLRAQAEATRVAEREILRLCEKYGGDTVVTAFEEVQDYVERLTRKRIGELPDGVWETEDYIDFDPAEGEGLVPVKVKLEIDGEELRYDLSGSHPAVATFLNSSFGTTFSGIVGGTKTFFPDVPLNSGFYRVIEVDAGEENTVINAAWPVAVTGFCSGGYEKVTNAVYELWSQVMPDRAMACCFNLEYLLVGGRDARTDDRPVFMWYDWMVGGWGGRNGKDGANCTSPVFGVGLAVQPLEGQERLTPVLTTAHQIVPDSGGPGRFRGGVGVSKGGRLTEPEGAVMSYCCDRARSITWGIEGGLPSIPHGVWLATARARTRRSSWARRSPTSTSAPATCSRGPRRAAAASATRWSATPRRWSRTSPTATSRSSARASTMASSSTRSTPSWRSTSSTQTRPRRSASGSAASAPAGSRRTPSRWPSATARGSSTPWTPSGATGSSSTGARASCWSARPSSSGRCSSAAPSITGTATRSGARGKKGFSSVFSSRVGS